VDVRAVVPADEGAIDSLQRGPRDLLLAEREGQIGGFWSTQVDPEPVARIQALAVRDDWPLPETLAALLHRAEPSLCARGVRMLAFIGAETWLLDHLARLGFQLSDTIVTMHKNDWRIPTRGNAQVTVDRASSGDLEAMLAIDARAFDVLWHNTKRGLVEYLDTAPYFVVARWNGRVVGYAHAVVAGRHGHLTRVAVHPDWQGRQIGARLLAESIDFFRQRGVYGITLNTQHANVRARRLYRWFGFRVLGQEAQVLVLALTSPADSTLPACRKSGIMITGVV
jgi:ribosomal-protein-alanine N-acetyltransferase